MRKGTSCINGSTIMAGQSGTKSPLQTNLKAVSHIKLQLPQLQLQLQLLQVLQLKL
jgi:hypothetical protein